MARGPTGMSRFYMMLGAIAFIGAGVLFWLAQRGGSVSIPANVTVLAADTAGFRGYIKGSPDAPVEITEYADYQCPACQDFAAVQMPTIEERLIRTGRVRWRYRDFPLDQIHPHARLAAHSAACADEQGKYWEQHQAIYTWQPDWTRSSNASGIFRDYARANGLDLAQYDGCMSSAKYAGRIQASYNEGLAVGVGSTPTFLIGDRLHPGKIPYDELRRLVDSIAPAQPAPATR